MRCVPALRVPLVHSLINHFRQNESTTTRGARGLRRHTRAPEKENPKKKISEIRVSKLVRHYTTIEGMHSSPRTQTPTTEPPGAPDHYRCRNRQASIDRKGETRRPTYIDKTAWRQHTYINTVSAYYLFWLR